MLCLKSKKLEKVIINGGQIVITLLDAGPGWARLGFDAPPEIVIHREEVQKRIDAGEPRPNVDDPPAITSTNWFKPETHPKERKST